MVDAFHRLFLGDRDSLLGTTGNLGRRTFLPLLTACAARPFQLTEHHPGTQALLMASATTTTHVFTPCGLVTLTTDFGTIDGYVGAMKGRILSSASELRITDLAHDIPAQNVIHGASTLAASACYWPRGTVHIAVVDPSVGTERRALAAVAGGQCFVGPDNGLLSPVLHQLGDICCHQITRNPNTQTLLPTKLAPTFHGRDLFAPIGAALACGLLNLEQAGPACEPQALVQPVPLRKEDHLEGEIVLFDHFGNAITNLRQEDLVEGDVIMVPCAGLSMPLLRTYAEVPAEEPIALLGSSGFLEIAIRDGHAGETLGLRARDRVRAKKIG